MPDSSIDIIQLVITVLAAAIPVSLYVARLHWKINRLESAFNNHPLLASFKAWEESHAVFDFMNFTLKSSRVEKEGND